MTKLSKSGCKVYLSKWDRDSIKLKWLYIRPDLRAAASLPKEW